MRAEVELLLYCTRTHIDAARAERVRQLLREDVNWDSLLHLALRHGLGPLLFWHLNAVGHDAVPSAALDQLRRDFYANVQHSLCLARELLKLLQLFAAQGIRALSFKGPLLAATAYGNLSLRQFRDLDILVQKQDLFRARDLLLAQGYQTKAQLDDKSEAGYLQSKYYIFVRADGRVRVDLQWQIVGKSFRFPLYIERVWERLQPVSFAGATVLHFPPEDLLLILCVHGSKHLWRKLKWVCDVAELIRVHRGMDWGHALDQARRTDSERMLTLGLFLAHDLLGTTLPEGVLQRVQADRAIQPVAAQVRATLFVEARRPAEERERFLFYFRMKKRLEDQRALPSSRSSAIFAPCRGSECKRAGAFPAPDSALFLPLSIAARPPGMEVRAEAVEMETASPSAVRYRWKPVSKQR